ncbi:MAG: YigZ family protein [Crocinitomicaceae bacterium]|nr:YigZ family protein [Crocinitomicaceae bacterium]
MSEKSTYKTLKNRSQGLYKENGSKFIGIAQACYSEEEAKGLMVAWGKEHHQARHLCYAYRFGVDKKVFRSNDDGEPNNSAGAPILGQITAFDLSNVLIGVVRYYGGTKLGVGGLINAYRTAAKEAIKDGDIIELEVFEWVKITFDYIDMSNVMNILKKHQLKMIDTIFEVNCELTTNLGLNFSEEIQMELKENDTVNIESKGIY